MLRSLSTVLRSVVRTASSCIGILECLSYQDTRMANVHSVNPVVSTVIVLDVDTDVPKANVTPIVLCAQSNNNPVDVLKKVSTENENPQPYGGMSTSRDTTSQYS